MIWVEATPLGGRRIRLFVDGLKSVVMIWGEATPLGGRIKIRFFDMGGGCASLLMAGIMPVVKIISASHLILCYFAKYFSILCGGMAVYDTL